MPNRRRSVRAGLAVAALALLAPALPTASPFHVTAGLASAEDAQTAAGEAGDLVRLPGRGEVKTERSRLTREDRLAPGGGLLMSFDGDEDGSVSPAEFETGLTAAFAAADSDGDGQLTVFEQLDWVESLPTRDGSLSNPVRFDPNLDRMVSYGEFSAVIRSLAEPYQDPVNGSVDLSQLRQSESDRMEERPDTGRDDPFANPRQRPSRAPRPS